MATALTSSRPTIHPFVDPLVATLADAANPASGREGQSTCEIHVEIKDVFNSETWRRIGELFNPYDYTTETVAAVLYKILLGALSHILPSM